MSAGNVYASPPEMDDQTCMEYRILMAYTEYVLATGEIKLQAPNIGDRVGFTGEEKLILQIAKSVNSIANVYDHLSSLVIYAQGPAVFPQGQEHVINNLVKLLMDSGDRLDHKLQQNPTLLKCVKETLTFSIFKEVTDQYLSFADNLLKQQSLDTQSCKVALCIRFTSQLTAVDNHPMNRVMGFGVKYLRENFSTWIQHQGGWNHVLGIKEDDDLE